MPPSSLVGAVRQFEHEAITDVEDELLPEEVTTTSDVYSPLIRDVPASQARQSAAAGATTEFRDRVGSGRRSPKPGRLPSGRSADALGAVDGLGVYRQAIARQPVLDSDVERELARRVRDTSDEEAAHALVLGNLRFVVHIARGYLGYGLPLEDLVQAGNLGLLRALRRFDPDHGVRLVSFAVYWIRAEIHDFLISNWRIVKVATTKAQRKLFFRLRGARAGGGTIGVPELAELSENLRVRPTDLVVMEGRLRAVDIAFNPADDEGAAPPRAPEAWLADDSDAIADFESAEWAAHYFPRLGPALAELDPRSRAIIESRWLNTPDEDVTLQSLARKYGISAERVRQIQQRALERLRRSIEVEAPHLRPHVRRAVRQAGRDSIESESADQGNEPGQFEAAAAV